MNFFLLILFKVSKYSLQKKVSEMVRKFQNIYPLAPN